MSYKFLKIADTYDITRVDEYTNPLSEPRLSRDMWRDEVLAHHEYERDCCSILYQLLNEYKAERDATFRKLRVAESENCQCEGFMRTMEDKIAVLELENQQLLADRDTATSNHQRDADVRNFVIVLLLGILVGMMFSS